MTVNTERLCYCGDPATKHQWRGRYGRGQCTVLKSTCPNCPDPNTACIDCPPRKPCYCPKYERRVNL